MLITGANAGLGTEIARQLASRPETAHIYLACRNRDKATTAKADLEAAAGKMKGPMVDQTDIFLDLANASFQDHANEAIHRFTTSRTVA